MAEVIRLDDALVQLKTVEEKEKSNHSKLCSGFTSRTFRLIGRVSRRLQRRSFHTFPNLIDTDAKTNECGLQETKTS